MRRLRHAGVGGAPTPKKAKAPKPKTPPKPKGWQGSGALPASPYPAGKRLSTDEIEQAVLHSPREPGRQEAHALLACLRPRGLQRRC